MAKNPDLRSVRVEIEGETHSREALDVPLVDAARKRSRLAVLAAVAVVALVVLAAIVAERDAESVEDATPASTTLPAQVDEPQGGQFGTALSGVPELFQPTTGVSQLESVVRVPSGFVGLTQQQTEGRVPHIVQSTNGVDWVEVDVVLDSSIPPRPADGPAPVYEKLIQIPDGFALLMRTSEVGLEDDPDRAFTRISRLTSADASTWRTDSRFVSFDSASGSSAVVSHVEASFVTRTRQPIENVLLQQLVDEHLISFSSSPALCSARSIDDELQAFPCDGGEVVAFGADDVVEPERFESLRECAIFLSQRWASESSFWLVQPQHGVVELTGARSTIFPPSVAADGRIVTIDFPSPPNVGELACGGLVELQKSPSPGVVVWTPENAAEPVRYDVPAEIDVSSLLSVRAEPTISNAGLLVLIGSGLTSIDLTSIDLDTGGWERVLTLPVRPDDETSVRITADGSRLIYLDSSRVTVIQLDDRLTGYVETAGGNRPGFPQIVYADNETVFARGANSIFKIDVPAS